MANSGGGVNEWDGGVLNTVFQTATNDSVRVCLRFDGTIVKSNSHGTFATETGNVRLEVAGH